MGNGGETSFSLSPLLSTSASSSPFSFKFISALGARIILSACTPISVGARILYVKEVLGHKNIQNTMVYVHLEEAIFEFGNYEFTVLTARTIKEAKKLLEVGFEYVAEVEGVKLFRKRK